MSDTVVSNIGAPQGTVLFTVLFTLFNSDYTYNSMSGFLQILRLLCNCGLYPQVKG